jgi:hypothetical protein
MTKLLDVLRGMLAIAGVGLLVWAGAGSQEAQAFAVGRKCSPIGVIDENGDVVEYLCTNGSCTVGNCLETPGSSGGNLYCCGGS